MNRLSDYPVVYKIAGAFILVLVATVMLGAIALFRLSAVREAGDETFRDGLPTSVALGDFKYNITRYRSFESASSLQVSAEQREMIEKTFVQLSAKADEALERYRALANSPKEVELTDRIDRAWKDYHNIHETYLQTYKQSGEKAAADYLLGASKANFSVLLGVVEDAISYNTDVVGKGIAGAGQTYESARYWILGLMIAAAAFAAALGLWLARSISVPLNAMTNVMEAIAHGDLDTEVPNADQKDEIGKLAGSMLAFKKQLAAAERSKAEQTEVIVSSIGTGLDHLAKGNLTHRISAELSGPFVKLKEDFNGAMVHLQDTLKQVLAATGQITNGAGEISQAADDLSRRTEQQAASLEETSAALEEITATVKATAANTKEVNSAMASARTAAEKGGQVVQTATQAMDAIAQSSRKITDIIGVIDEIAFQTNLLALNAGVEAARAGDAGRGFAVVASEVRGLAQRSSEAAKEIKALINASGSQVADGVKHVGATGEALHHIVEQVQQINKIVNEMATAAEQEATGIEEVNTAVSQMDQMTQQNAAMVEQSTAASRNLAGETENLQRLVGFFDVGEVVRTASAPKPMPRTKPQMKTVSRAGGAAPVRRPQTEEWSDF